MKDPIKIAETRHADDSRDVAITCTLSDKPLSRANQYGMFCAEPNCPCEVEAKKAAETFSEILGLKTL